MKQFLVPAVLLAVVATTVAVAAGTRAPSSAATGTSSAVCLPSDCCPSDGGDCCDDESVKAQCPSSDSAAKCAQKKAKSCTKPKDAE